MDKWKEWEKNTGEGREGDRNMKVIKERKKDMKKSFPIDF
jgi:hypothetical protein